MSNNICLRVNKEIYYLRNVNCILNQITLNYMNIMFSFKTPNYDIKAFKNSNNRNMFENCKGDSKKTQQGRLTNKITCKS